MGHAKSPYYTMKEPMRREIYATKCMKYLTYLDYSALEKTGKSFEAKLEQKDEQIRRLTEDLSYYKRRMDNYDEMLRQLQQDVNRIGKIGKTVNKEAKSNS